MAKQQVLEKINKRWEELQHSFAGLTNEQLARPESEGGWTVKDILVHVRAWEEEALTYLPMIVEGKRLPRYKDLYGGIHAFNQKTYEENKDKPVREVLADLKKTHERLLTYLQSVPAEQFLSKKRFYRRLAADTYNHYPEHSDAILNLRSAN